DEKALLDVGADDAGERDVVLLEGPLADEPAAPQTLQLLERDVLRGARRRRHLYARVASEEAVEAEGDEQRQGEAAAQQIVRAPVDRDLLGRLDVADVARVAGLLEEALDRNANLGTGGLAQVGAGDAVLNGRRLHHVLARAVADERVPAREDGFPVARHGRIDAVVDDFEVADTLARLRDDYLGARVARHLDHVAEAAPDAHGLRLDMDGDRDRRGRLVRPSRDRQEGESQEHPHWRRSRMRKKRSSGSVYGRSVCTTTVSTSVARSIRSRSVRAAAECSANAARTRASPVSTT